MIPDYIEEGSPPGEVMVFSKLQNSSKNWVAIHSLDLAPYNRNKRTEIDFVIIIPRYGILCVEVKSQKNIYFDGQCWQPRSIKRSPFKQALDARCAFYRRLKERMGGIYKNIPVMHCCIFPLSNFQIDLNASILPFEIIDRKSYESCKTSDDFCVALVRLVTLAIKNDPQVQSLQRDLTDEEVDEITNFCYPVRKRKPEKREEIRRRQTELEKILREQQKPVLSLVAYNARVLIDGGAGTGKSLIGMEVANRKSEEGLRVAYVCFNKIIGKWVDGRLSRINRSNLVAGTAHSILLEMTGITVPDDVDSDWWEKKVPELVEEKLTNPDIASVVTFDYLVIDEAQDILARSGLWDCLKLIIEGGLSNGSFLILGDFVNQALVKDVEVMEDNFRELGASTTKWPLTENCRNYSSVGEVALALSASDRNTWSGYMRAGGSLDNWNLDIYDNDVEQVIKIRNCIQLARNNGFKNSEITLLTFGSINKSIIDNLIRDGLIIEQASVFYSTEVRYATINAFKGMENKIIIISDVVLSPQCAELERKVFYTGLTRATEKLFIFCRKGSADILQKWVIDRGEKL